MTAITVEAATVVECEPDAAAAAEKSPITLNYEAMLAALNDLLAESREETRQAEASGKVVDAERIASNRQPPNPMYGSSARRLSRI